MKHFLWTCVLALLAFPALAQTQKPYPGVDLPNVWTAPQTFNAAFQTTAAVTVATLPAASSNPYMIQWVSDSTSVTLSGQPCVGGGSTKAVAFSDGIVWHCSGGALPSPTTNGIWQVVYNVTANAAVSQTTNQQGLGGRAILGGTATDLVGFGDNGTVIDHDPNGSAVLVQTLPTATVLGNPGFVYVYSNHSPQIDSIVPTSWTINGTSSISVPPNSYCRVKTDPGSATNWLADCSGTTAITYPLAVTGGNSGGIPYFSLNTVQAASGLLALKHVLLGGGSGAAPTSDANLDDGQTTASTLTYGGTGGITTPLVTASGIVMPAGAALGHATASTVTLEAPATATAYEWKVPTAAATGIPLLTNTANVVAQTYLTSTAAGDVPCGTGTTWSVFAGNTSGTRFLSENSSGVCAWSSGTGSGAALDAITSASTSPTPLANGNNAQSWGWLLSSNVDAMTFGEAAGSPSTGGTVTTNLANQVIVEAETAVGSTASPLSVTQGALSGSLAIPALQISSTWNNAATTFQGIVLSVTSTAAATGSRLLTLYGGAGTTSEFNVYNDGTTNIGASLRATGQSYESQAIGTSITFQGGLDGSSSGVALGSGTFRGANNSNTGVNSAGGAATVNGGDATGSTANALLGGAVTIRGGNATQSTSTGAAGGNVSITGGSCTLVATATACPGVVKINQPYFTTGTANANDLACITATNTVASCPGTGNGSFIGVIDSVSGNNVFVTSLGAGGTHTFNALSATFTAGHFVCESAVATSAQLVVDNGTSACPAGFGVGIYVGATGTTATPLVAMNPAISGTSTPPVAGTNISLAGSTISFNPNDTSSYWLYSDFDSTFITGGGSTAQRWGPNAMFAQGTPSNSCSTNGVLIAGNGTGAAQFICANNATVQDVSLTAANVVQTYTAIWGNMSTYTNWSVSWTIQTPTVATNEKFYFGVGDSASGYLVSSGNAMGWRFDTVKSDVVIKPFCNNGGTFNTPAATTGTYPTPTSGHTYTMVIFSTVAGTLQAKISDNGSVVATQTSVCSTFPTAAMSPVMYFGGTATGAQSPEVDIDRFSYLSTGIVR